MERIFLKNNVYYIPIGNSCKPTWYLQKMGYRKFAFPFDWTVTPLESVIEILKNDFEEFFYLDNLIFLSPAKRLLFKDDEDNPKLVDDVITPVYDKKYHILYVHDFSEKGKLEYEQVKKKYMRRVARLKKILEDKSNEIIFIYSNDSINNWQETQYGKVNYLFKKLTQEQLENLYVNRDNIKFIALENFIKEVMK